MLKEKYQNRNMKISEETLEIINRPNNSIFEEYEIIKVIKEYIYLRKGVIVEINVYKNFNMQYYKHPIMKVQIMKQLQLLHNAFERSLRSLRNIDNNKDWDFGIVK